MDEVTGDEATGADVVWVELLSRHRAVLSRHRCAGRGIRIGRAYTNDVVVDDPYVAPEHVHIVRGEDGALVVEDLGSANGLFAERGGRVRSLALADNSVFRIGNSWLRVRRTDHAVAPERRLGGRPRSWAALPGLAASALGVEAASVWLTDFSEPKAADYLVPLLGLAMAVALWAALWSVVARIFSGHARFARNLLVALAGALGFEAVSALADLGAFGFSWSALATYAYVEFWCLLAALCFVHLRLVNPARATLSGVIVAATLAVVVALQTLLQLDTRPGFDQSTVRQLLPPALRLSPVEDEAAFFAAVGKLQAKLDKDRAADP